MGVPKYGRHPLVIDCFPIMSITFGWLRDIPFQIGQDLLELEIVHQKVYGFCHQQLVVAAHATYN